MQHNMACPYKLGPHTDAAKRMHDEYTMHRVVDPYGCIGKWIAIALADGRGDKTLYDSKQDAIRHMHGNEYNYAYIQMRPCDMSVCDAEIFISVHRRMYKAGVRMIDPDNARMPEPIRRVSREDQLSQVRSILNGGKTRPSNLIIGGN